MKSKKNKPQKFLISLLIIILFTLTLYNLYIMYKNIDISNNEEYTSKRASLSTNNLNNVDTLVIKDDKRTDIIEQVTKSVVGISKLTNTGGSIFSNATSDELGLGTGIIVSDNGYILSNNHVTGDKYSTCYVTIDEKSYKGSVVWSNEELDLSIVKIWANSLLSVDLGDSSNLKVGKTVFAIGNPIGYEFNKTVTSGIISALNRTVKINENDDTSYVSNLIQTDATINPGNSGGPLIDVNGKVVGINTIKITSAEGIGFAIPINVIKPVVDSFKSNGKFDEAILGIRAYDCKIAKYLKQSNKIESGIYISSVSINGPAYNVGIKEGDLIIKIDENEIKTVNDLREYIYNKKPNDIIKINVIRNGKSLDFDAILGRK